MSLSFDSGQDDQDHGLENTGHRSENQRRKLLAQLVPGGVDMAGQPVAQLLASMGKLQSGEKVEPPPWVENGTTGDLISPFDFVYDSGTGRYVRRVKDRMPTISTLTGGYVWFELLGEDQTIDNGPSYLPRAIYTRLKGFEAEGSNWRRYPNLEAALNAYRDATTEES